MSQWPGCITWASLVAGEMGEMAVKFSGLQQRTWAGTLFRVSLGERAARNGGYKS